MINQLVVSNFAAETSKVSGRGVQSRSAVVRACWGSMRVERRIAAGGKFVAAGFVKTF